MKLRIIYAFKEVVLILLNTIVKLKIEIDFKLSNILFSTKISNKIYLIFTMTDAFLRNYTIALFFLINLSVIIKKNINSFSKYNFSY